MNWACIGWLTEWFLTLVVSWHIKHPHSYAFSFHISSPNLIQENSWKQGVTMKSCQRYFTQNAFLFLTPNAKTKTRKRWKLYTPPVPERMIGFIHQWDRCFYNPAASPYWRMKPINRSGTGVHSAELGWVRYFTRLTATHIWIIDGTLIVLKVTDRNGRRIRKIREHE